MISVKIIAFLVLQLTLVSVALAFEFSFDSAMEFEKVSSSSDDVCLSSRKFSSVLHRTLTSETDQNVINSPFSLHTILTFLFYGAKSATATDLKAGLFLTEMTLESGIKCLTSSLKKLKNVDFNIANSIYIQDNLHVEQDFVLNGAEIFKASVTQVDFKEASKTVECINNWVSDETRKKIKDLITIDDIKEDTLILMINAVYFKSFWENKFNPQLTKKQEFYNINNKKKKVDMMYKSSYFSHGILKDFNARVLEIPYQNDNFSMIIVLPNDVDGLLSLEQNFNLDAVLNADARKSKVELFLPKFQLEIKNNLKETLRKLGMSKIFEDDADLSGISNIPLKVSQVVQKVFIEVNEEGSEAVAASGVQMRLRRSIDIEESEEFRVDRPFIFVIKYKPSNLPIFLGSIRDIGEVTEKDEL